MSKAYSVNRNSVISVFQYDPIVDHSLLCEDASCRTPVTYVNQHFRQISGIKVSVGPYFRLKSKDSSHSETCSYNLSQQIEIIARKSNTSIVKNLKTGNYHFRLNLVHTSMKNANSSKTSDATDDNDKSSNRRAKKYINQGVLCPYISSMKKILALRSQLESNEDLKSLITLEYQLANSDRVFKINWEDFYFTMDTYDRCYRYIQMRDFDHFICVEGQIKDIYTPTEKFPYYSIHLCSPWIKERENGFLNIPAISITIKDKLIIDYIKQNSKFNFISVFSNFRISKCKTDFTKKINFLNISGTINSKNHFILYNK